MAVLIVVVIAGVLFGPYVSPFIHRGRNRSEVVALYNSLQLGMTKQQVQQVIDSGKYPKVAHRTGAAHERRW